VIGTVSGRPALASPEITIDALLFPAVRGANVTSIVQLPLVPTLPEHVLVMLNSVAFAPVSETALTAKLPVPTLESVTGTATEVEPAGLVGKLSIVGNTLASPIPPVPEATKLTVPPVAVSVTSNAPNALPEMVGLKMTLIKQGLSPVAHDDFVSTNSAELVDSGTTEIASSLDVLTVTDIEALVVSSAVAGKLKPAGLTVGGR